MPVKYVANLKAWMTREISDWLKQFSEDIKRQGCKICRQLDNCCANHVEGHQLSNIELQYFPANCTLLIQPLEKRVLNSFKWCCFRRLIDKILLDIRLKRQTKISIYQAIEMLAASWQEVEAETVANCFVKAQISKVTQAGVCEDEVVPSNPPDVTEAQDARRTNGGWVPDDIALGDFLYANNGAASMGEISNVALVETV